ncbi:MAG: penicillin-binding protein activator [Gammaproteobacteria bacterium]|nr:MAG: penicillin-binding protein activator [Gammaproteobacteria bacterium]
MIKQKKMKSSFIINHRTLFIVPVLLLLLMLQGCQTTGLQLPRDTGPASVQKADAAAIKGENLLAAKEYLRLAAEKKPPEKQFYQLKAVEALIKAGQIHEARKKINAIHVQKLGAGPRSHKLTLRAFLATVTGNHENALRLLTIASRSRNLSPTLRGKIYRVRAITYLALDKPFSSALNLILREKYIVDKKEISRNQMQLWKILSSQPLATLQAELRKNPGPIQKGWIELAIMTIKNAKNPRNLDVSVKKWRTTHPKHPVEDILLSSLGSGTQTLLGRINRIALLLPLSDAYKRFGSAVYDGFMAMSKNNKDPDKPRIKVYNIGSNPDDIEKFYKQAVKEGAQFVVGPLGRSFVDKLVKSTNLEVPTLLLSHTDKNISSSTSHVYQFGLQPEQEAKQVAERAYLDGHRVAAVLFIKTEQSERMLKAFTEHWEQLGGIILASEQFDLKPKDGSKPDYTGSVKRLLHIGQSEKRKAELQLLVREKLYFFPRRRADIDFVFIASGVREARQLKPLLNFYRASRLPVYATSRVFVGKGNPREDIDLDGIMFGDMPWMLVGSGRIKDLRQNVQGNWSRAHSPWDRLYALGMDSYSIIPHLDRINASDYSRYQGVTSGLSITRDGHIQRQLTWAIFKAGVPRLLDRFYKHTGQFETGDGSKKTSDAGSGS